MLTIRALRSDEDIHSAFPLMATLRDRIQPVTFLAEVRRQQLEGYELIGAFAGRELVSLAGVRRTHTLSRGAHLFVDDLVTDERLRGAGHGAALVRWLSERAAAEGIPRIYLDSRVTAKGFYEKLGFTFQTSVPCWLDVPKYLAEGRSVL
jgi:GNAT superfamily N-acetyltransferase